MLITISGPAGAGKTTLSNNLKERAGAQFLPSWTTRPQRVGELKKTDYHHISVTDYLKLLQDGEILLHEVVATNYYGTKNSDVTAALQDEGTIWIADLTAHSVIELFTKGYQPTTCIIMTVPKTEAQARMRKRGDRESDILLRLQRHDEELQNAEKIRELCKDTLYVDASMDSDEIFEIVAGRL